MAATLYTTWTSLSDEEITTGTIQDVLCDIPDDLWVAAACADRILDDAIVQRALVDLGIARTQNVVERCKIALKTTSNIGDNSTSSTDDALLNHFRVVPTDAQLCHIRTILLDRSDKVNTYLELPKERLDIIKDIEGDIEEWEDDPWAEGGTEAVTPSTVTKNTFQLPISLSAFLLRDLVWSACQLALSQCFEALRALIRRHRAVLWPYRLIVLDSIPEHIHPTEYLDILPSFDITNNIETPGLSHPWRAKSDFSEAPETSSSLKELGLYIHSTVPSVFIQPQDSPMTSVELSTWYKNRVNKIISTTGMIDIALATIQHGASQGIPGLDEIGEELSLLSRLVYDAPQGDENSDDWTLSRWSSMDAPAVVRAYLAYSTPESLPADISRLVMPYLFVLESRSERAGIPDPSLPSRVLYDYILSASLEKAVSIFEASQPTLPTSQRVIWNDEDMARLALACLYGNNSLDEWPIMSRIFECLPAWDTIEDDDEANTTIASLAAFVKPTTSHPYVTANDLLVFFKPLSLSSLSRALDILDVHLEAGEILSRWSVPAQMRWFLQSSEDISEQRSWANRMARRAGGSEDQLNTEEDWEWLLEDMLKLTGKSETGLRSAFGLLTREEVTQIFLSGLLSTGRFKIAQSILQSQHSKIDLSLETIEDVCVTCSHEFYDNASSGNCKIGDMKLAYECLDVPCSSERLLKEKEFIEATSRISSFNIMSRPGIPISPIEIRLTKDRLSLISRVLSSNDDAYKHTEVILDLCHKLGFNDDIAAEVKVLAMLADTALQAEDFVRAYENSDRMVNTVLKLREASFMDLEDLRVRDATEVCWIACFQLGRQPEFDDLEKKLTLLGRSMEFCPPEKINDVLTAWRRLEKEDISEREEAIKDRRSSTTAASNRQKTVKPMSTNVASSLRSRLQDFHMPSPPLLSTPDAAALATRTFRSVASNFQFAVGQRGRSQTSEGDDTGSWQSSNIQRRMMDVQDSSSQAARVFSKGIGWLIGADED